MKWNVSFVAYDGTLLGMFPMDPPIVARTEQAFFGGQKPRTFDLVEVRDHDRAAVFKEIPARGA